MTAARRLAAILAVDVGGYSHLTGEDKARARRGAARTSQRHASNRLIASPLFPITPSTNPISKDLNVDSGQPILIGPEFRRR